MPLIKFDKINFINAMQPMVVSIVIQAFEEELESRMNTIIEDTFNELKKKLPERVEAAVRHQINHERVLGEDVKIEIEIKE